MFTEPIFLQSGSGAAMFLFFLILLMWLAVAAIVGSHASNNGRSGPLWGVIVFFTGLIGVGIYLLVIVVDDSGGPKRICPDCRLENPSSATYCSDCGHQFKANAERATDPSA